MVNPVAFGKPLPLTVAGAVEDQVPVSVHPTPFPFQSLTLARRGTPCRFTWPELSAGVKRESGGFGGDGDKMAGVAGRVILCDIVFLDVFTIGYRCPLTRWKGYG